MSVFAHLGIVVVSIAVSASCATRKPTTLDDLRSPEWMLAQVELQSFANVLWRWDMAGGTGCPSTRDLMRVAPRLKTHDPWGRPYSMRCENAGFQAMSLGPDGVAGTRDDVHSAMVVPRRTQSDVGGWTWGSIRPVDGVLLKRGY